MNKIAIFVDVQNIYYTSRDVYNRQFDYSSFWERIQQQGEIVIANAYAIERNDSKQHGFQNALRKIGFNIKLKPFIQRSDGSAKGDWDVGITIDAIDAAPDVDQVVLLSGDGDFDLLLTHMSNQFKIKTQVFGVPGLTAKSLIDACDEFIMIDEALLL